MRALPADGRSAADRLRLVLLDDHALFRTSLGRFLESECGFEIIGERATTHEALELLNASPVDVVLLELNIGADSGTEFISAARRAGYQGRFLIVTGVVDVTRSAIALKRGASGIFLKSKSPELLIHAIRVVMSGEVWVDQNIIQLLVDQYSRKVEPKLVGPRTERQQRVLHGVLEGCTSKQISRTLGVSEGTVKAVLQQLFHKTGVRTRSQLVRAAFEGSLRNAREFRQ